MTYAMNAVAYKKAIVSIKTRSGTLTKDIHRAAVAAMIFSGTEAIGGDKNATPAKQLAEALAPGMPRNKVIAWFNHFTNVRITVSKQKDGSFTWGVKNIGPTLKDGTPNDDYQELTPELLALAIKTPYWELNPESDIKELDIEAMIKASIKRIEKAMEDGKLKAAPANAQRLAGLRALVTTGGNASQEVPFDNPTAELAKAAKAAAGTPVAE